MAKEHASLVIVSLNNCSAVLSSLLGHTGRWLPPGRPVAGLVYTRKNEFHPCIVPSQPPIVRSRVFVHPRVLCSSGCIHELLSCCGRANESVSWVPRSLAPGPVTTTLGHPVEGNQCRLAAVEECSSCYVIRVEWLIRVLIQTQTLR